jgi:hypothetical protein
LLLPWITSFSQFLAVAHSGRQVSARVSGKAAIEEVVKRIQRIKTVKRLGSGYRLHIDIAIDVPFVRFDKDSYIQKLKAVKPRMGVPGGTTKVVSLAFAGA